MGIFDFLKQKKQEQKVVKESLRLSEIPGWMAKKRADENLQEKRVLVQVKQIISELIQELKEKSKPLNEIDISKRKEDNRLKEVVTDNLKKYKEYIEQLIKKLELLTQKEHNQLSQFIEDINKILEDFQKRSKSSYERATILIGKELGNIKETLSSFFRDLNRIISENENIIINLKVLESIEKKLQELNENEEETKIISENLEGLEKKRKDLDKKNKQIEEEIEDKKKSKEYTDEKLKKLEAIAKKKEIEKTTLKLKSFIDFKLLEKIHHTNPKKMNLIKSYEEDFNQIFNRENKELFDLIGEQNNSKDKIKTIQAQIKIIVQELEEIEEISGLGDGLDFILAEKKHLDSSIRELETEKLRNSKRIETLREDINSIKKSLAEEITKLNIEII